MELIREPLRVAYLGNLAQVRDCLARMRGVTLAGCVLQTEDEEYAEFAEAGARGGYAAARVETREDLTRALQAMAPLDAGVIANFGIILSAGQLACAKLGFVNVHLGLLPEYPGRRPIEAALAAGEPVTGVTLHEAVEKPDAGPVIWRSEVAVGEIRIPEVVFERLTRLAAQVLETRLQGWLANKIGR